LAGIGEASYYRWMETGEADTEQDLDTPYPEFRLKAEQSMCEARTLAHRHIRTAMKKDWRAAAWYLEGTQPQEWGRADRHRIEHGRAPRTEIPVIPDTPERLRDVASLLREVGVLDLDCRRRHLGGGKWMAASLALPTSSPDSS
jgi:hypothetical protein